MARQDSIPPSLRHCQYHHYLSGDAFSTNVLPGVPISNTPTQSGFVAKLSRTLETLGWTQLLGHTVNGVARNTSLTAAIWTAGDRYASGSTDSTHTYGYFDGFLVKINDPIPYTAPPCRVCGIGLQYRFCV